MIRGLPADTGRLLKSRSSSIRWLVIRRSPACGWQCGLPTIASGGCLSWRGEDARSGTSGRWRDRSTTDPPSAATQRIKALQALLSRHIAAHLGDAWLHPAEGTQHSELHPCRHEEQPVLDVHNKPDRHRPQRTERRRCARLRIPGLITLRKGGPSARRFRGAGSALGLPPQSRSLSPSGACMAAGPA